MGSPAARGRGFQEVAGVFFPINEHVYSHKADKVKTTNIQVKLQI